MQSKVAVQVWDDRRLALVLALLGAILSTSLLYTAFPFVLLLAVPTALYFATRPYELLLVMVFLIPFNFVFKIGPIPVAAELLKVIAWIPLMIQLVTLKQEFKKSRFDWCFAVLVVLLLLSVFRSNDLPFTLKESVRLASNFGLCYLVLNLINSTERIFQALRVLAFSTLLVACYGFYQFAIQDFGWFFWIVNPRLDTSLSHGRFAFWEWRNRITSVLTSEMELGHYFNLCLPIGVVLWLREGRRRISSKWLWITMAMLVGLLLTFTFGAWLALILTTLLYAFVYGKKKRLRMALTVATALVLVSLLLFFGPFRPLLEEKVTGSGGLAWDAFTRYESWMLAVNTWLAHPLIGTGYGNFPSVTVGNLTGLNQEWAVSGSSPHNIYLYLLSELGLIGFCPMMVIFLGTIRTNLQILSNPQLSHVGFALAFALTTGLLGGCSDDSVLYGPHASYLFWFLAGLSEAAFNLFNQVSEIRFARACY